MFEVEQDGVATAQPTEVRGGLVTLAADRQLVGTEDHELLQVPRLQADAALAVDRVLEGGA